MAEIKRIGILTSGGDCAGLNAVIRAVVHRAIQGYGWEVLGIRRSTHGLMSTPPEVVPMSLELFSGSILREGGTFIGTTNRGNPFAYPMPDGTHQDRSAEVGRGYHELGLDALVAIGGDGSFRILYELAQRYDMNIVGIPKTIDNDVVGTENAIGYITAVNVATEALDRLQTTAASHSRVMILEVMGRDAGHIALSSGIAGGVDIILIPEIPYRLEVLDRKIREVRERMGRNFSLIVVAEGCTTETGAPVTITDSEGSARYGGIGHYLADNLQRLTGAETRFNMLGHVQRGGVPSTTDRVLGAAFGVRAVDMVAKGEFGRVVVWQKRHVTDLPMELVASRTQGVELDGDLVRTARGLGISFGDR